MSIIYPKKTPLKSLNKKAIILSILIVFQLIYGAFTAGLDAGKGYPSINIFAFPNQIRSFFNDGMTVLFIHRYLAVVITLYTIYLYLSEVNLKQLLPFQRQGLMIVLIVVLTQVTLGIMTLLSNVPVSLGVIHQAGAVILLTSCVYLIKRT